MDDKQAPPAYGISQQPASYGTPLPDIYQQQAANTGYTMAVPTTRVTLVEFGEFPVLTVCPHCNMEVITTTESEIGTYTCLCFGLCCVFSAGICSLIPCCCRRCKDIKHKCPRCRKSLGLFKRL